MGAASEDTDTGTAGPCKPLSCSHCACRPQRTRQLHTPRGPSRTQASAASHLVRGKSRSGHRQLWAPPFCPIFLGPETNPSSPGALPCAWVTEEGVPGPSWAGGSFPGLRGGGARGRLSLLGFLEVSSGWGSACHGGSAFVFQVPSPQWLMWRLPSSTEGGRPQGQSLGTFPTKDRPVPRAV